MSYTKWRKALLALAASEVRVTKLEWKFIGEEKVYSTGIPQASDIGDTRLSDGAFQPFEYKEIEWLDICSTEPTSISRDLSATGRLLIEVFPTKLRIIAYKSA